MQKQVCTRKVWPSTQMYAYVQYEIIVLVEIPGAGAQCNMSAKPPLTLWEHNTKAVCDMNTAGNTPTHPCSHCCQIHTDRMAVENELKPIKTQNNIIKTEKNRKEANPKRIRGLQTDTPRHYPNP